MAENAYTRQITITVVEIVPDRNVLPDCVAFTNENAQCPYKARYEQNGNPVCGVHMGKPSTWFIPVKDRKRPRLRVAG